MKFDSIKKEGQVNIVVFERDAPVTTPVKVEVPYTTIISHLAAIDQSIANLQAEKVEYLAIKDAADIEIAKI